MEKKVIRTISFLAFALTLLLNGCNDNDITITIDQIKEALRRDSVEKGKLISPHFSPNIDHKHTGFSSLIPFPKGCYMQIYIYNQDEYPGKEQWMYMGVYKAYEDGKIESLYSKPQLKPGVYNFYATGTAGIYSNQGPTINPSTGHSISLSNGIDYLWWKSENVTISATNSQIPIIFKHACSKLKIEMEAAHGHTLSKINQLAIRIGYQNEAVMDLRTGYITPITTLNSYGDLARIDHLDAYLYMLPLKTSSGLNATVSVTLDNQEQWFHFLIPPTKSNIFESDKEYEYEVTFGLKTRTVPEELEITDRSNP